MALMLILILWFATGSKGFDVGDLSSPDVESGGRAGQRARGAGARIWVACPLHVKRHKMMTVVDC